MKKRIISILVSEEEYTKLMAAIRKQELTLNKRVSVSTFMRESAISCISGNGHMPAKQESEQKNESGMIPSAQPIEDDHQPGVYDAEQDSQQDDTQSRGLFADIDF